MTRTYRASLTVNLPFFLSPPVFPLNSWEMRFVLDIKRAPKLNLYLTCFILSSRSLFKIRLKQHGNVAKLRFKNKKSLYSIGGPQTLVYGMSRFIFRVSHKNKLAKITIALNLFIVCKEFPISSNQSHWPEFVIKVTWTSNQSICEPLSENLFFLYDKEY